ncbi:wax ester/triacylglycerol synthase family O-acyltransferase [Parahaliea maris]|uniref:diacylglycerol O-acyltransferase n=1 Tax=Parahaliea maris TaxID=2716870 RepID=A0A5C9A5J1_9GAMM|nr:wax ester/triacylglycerol synthase family O-acyltransferase [Parahaliea maris]TXS96165.1 wax ester/triacylglycerol synthase family O-acyltransferase [Parahaliea maris]
MADTIPLGRTDRFLLKLESADTPAHTASLSTFKLPAGAHPGFIRDLVQELSEQAVTAPPFNYVLAQKGDTAWTVLPPEDIDLDYHVRHSALPWPGGERELGSLISRLHARPLDFNRPLWELNVIEGLENGRFATYLKMHHALADGAAVIGILTDSLSTNSDEPPKAPWARSFATTLREERESIQPPEQPAAQSLLQALGKVATSVRTRPASGFVGPFVAPKSVFNTKITGARRYATQQIELQRLKAIGAREKVSVNDAFLAILSSALRRYLQEIDELPDRPLVAAVPAATLRETQDGLGNSVTVIYASLATNLEDPVERMHVISESMRQGKQFISELNQQQIAILNGLVLLPAAFLNTIGGGTPSRPIVNVTISNVQGPRHTLWFGQAECEALYPCSMIVQAQALNITARGYRDHINLGIVGARDSLPSIQRLAVYTLEALEEIEQRLGL